MRYGKQIITTVGTLTLAAGIGFAMEKTQSAQEIYGDVRVAASAQVLDNSGVVLDVQQFELTSAELDTSMPAPQAEQAVTLAAASELPMPRTPTEPLTPNKDAVAMSGEMPSGCDVVASARPVAAAMVNLTLSAPCLPNERVTVHHSGLLFNQTTDEAGNLDIVMPAMTTEAVFIVAFSNGDGGVAQTTVEDLETFDRVALQWKGDTGFELHAREFGAAYGEAGHVWSGESRDMSYAVTGEGGYISRLGDPSVPDGLVAEVYTFPSGSAQSAGDVDLSVETEVAGNNCGTEIEAQTLQTERGQDITSRDLTLSVPDCDAAGNFLVLNNLFTDLRVALN